MRSSCSACRYGELNKTALVNVELDAEKGSNWTRGDEPMMVRLWRYVATPPAAGALSQAKSVNVCRCANAFEGEVEAEANRQTRRG
jgi:hypothetical protein